jgi:ribosomal protein S11
MLLPLTRPSFTNSVLFKSGLAPFTTNSKAPQLSEKASAALQSIRESIKKPILRKAQLTRKEKASMQGNVGKYLLKGDKEEFHNIDRNRHGRIFEPSDQFEIVISSSKNNCWLTVINRGRKARTVFTSNCGNVGIRDAKARSPRSAYRVAENVARKLKRLGVSCASVRFRKLMKVDMCLQAFQGLGLNVTKLTHEPRLPKGKPNRVKKRRRV